MTVSESASGSEILTSTQVAQDLGIRSKVTIKNWLESGFFPGSFQGEDGEWLFSRSCVERVRIRIEALRRSVDR